MLHLLDYCTGAIEPAPMLAKNASNNNSTKCPDTKSRGILPLWRKGLTAALQTGGRSGPLECFEKLGKWPHPGIQSTKSPLTPAELYKNWMLARRALYH